MRLGLTTGQLLILALMSGNAQAWQGPPYAGYWPNAWPGQGQTRGPGFSPSGVHRWSYGGRDWKMRGYMTEWGDMRVVIEYHGNINNNFYGNQNWSHGYGGYWRPPFYGWR